MSTRTVSTALILVDLQEDYLAAPTLEPNRADVIDAAREVLALFRAHSAPIAHVRTRIEPSGSNAMPHRRANPLCVAGTPGAAAPTALREQPGEAVIPKQFYSSFSDGSLDSWLRGRGIQTVVIAGAFTHACVRQAAIDAYERGYTVHIAVEACASNAPQHAKDSLQWMGSRFVTLSRTADIDALLSETVTAPGNPDPVSAAVESAVAAQWEWSARPLRDRRAFVLAWREALATRFDALVAAIVDDVHKPISLARDEVHRALAHIDAALAVFTEAAFAPERIADGVVVTREPVGTVALVMPWNNPVALPVSNLAPALLGGNSVVFKPAAEVPRCAAELQAALAEAGMPNGVVTVVPGTVEAGRALVHHPGITAVAVTGSIRTGRDIAVSCANRFVPVRAELGGNNALIVLPDANLPVVARDLVRNAFGFAGQRCTALRRAVVHTDVLDQFITLLSAEASAIVVSDPMVEDTLMGPMVSERARERVYLEVQDAVERGAILRHSGRRIDVNGLPGLTPTVLLCATPTDSIVQQESFGPVLVVQPAESLEHAIELANGVEHGLVQAACTTDPTALAQIRRAAQVGMLQHHAGALPVHDLAAFSGWKASGVGGAEHGRWDLDFYTRPRTSYS